MTTALVVGFGRFPGAPDNPSAKVACAIARRRRRPALAGTKIVPAILPTTYHAVENDLPALLDRYDPDVVLFFGLASRAEAVCVESRAVNAASAFHADAKRMKMPGREVVRGAPQFLGVRAPIQKLAAAVRDTGIAVRHSRDAGRYICNASLFASLEAARRTGRPRQVAFIHIPWPRSHARPTRPTIDALVRAGEAALVAMTAANKRG
jgi:pyroglutamyl-peptidase